MSDRIELRGLKGYGHHGVFPSEKREGQWFLVDITCWLDFTAAAEQDDIAQTVHYGELAELAYDVITGEPKDLIEAVAAEIADKTMEAYPMIFAAEVTVHKPAAPIPLAFADVAVVARRSRRSQAAPEG